MTPSLERYGLFLNLLECGLDGSTPVLPGKVTQEEWEFLYATARRQAVQGLIYDSLEMAGESSIPADLAARWALETVRLEQNYEKVKRTAEKQAAAWKKHGIGAVMVKGLRSARYYRHPEHRVMGDIDWWFLTPDDWNAALDLLHEAGITPGYDSDGDLHYILDGTVIEHHRKGLEYAGPCGELLLLNKHILHHAMVMGVGMRHICDYKAALNYFKGQYDPDEYVRLLEDEGLSAWTEVLDGMPDRFLEMVMEDGNLGLDKKHRLSGFFRRAAFFLRIAPGPFLQRWKGLVLGRLKRK